MRDVPRDPTVFIVDDEVSVRDSLAVLVRSLGYWAETFESGDAYLAVHDPQRRGCVLLDMRMPGGGMMVFERIVGDARHLPVIFLTAHGDLRSAVYAMKCGAVEFLPKTCSELELVGAIEEALKLSAEAHRETAERRIEASRFDGMTPREWDVLRLVLAGEPNKSIATKLGLSRRGVETRRASIMSKTGASSLPELVALACKAASLDGAHGESGRFWR
jgi:FixJ family two-component response regulator